MNTVDPNEKVAPVESSHHEVADAAPAVASEPAESVEASASEGDKSVAPENLPKYHHHRSTALW